MPKRTNDFQRLVYLVKSSLADGASVKESKLLKDRITGTLREVDIYIEGKVGGQSVAVSVECRDHARRVDISWVEAMKAKHERLATNLLILASRIGFTQEATDVARTYGIVTVALHDVSTTDFPRMLSESSKLWIKSFTVSPDKVVIRVKPTNVLKDGKISDFLEAENVVVMPDNLLYSGDGAELGQVQIAVTQMLQTPILRSYFQENGTPEHVRFELRWEPPTNNAGNPYYLKKLDPETLREIEYIRVIGPCTVQVAQFGLKRARLGEVHIAWGKTHAAGNSMLFVATRDASGKETLAIDVSGFEPQIKSLDQLPKP